MSEQSKTINGSNLSGEKEKTKLGMAITASEAFYDCEVVTKRKKTLSPHAINVLLNNLKEINEEKLPLTIAENVPLQVYNNFLESEHRFPGMLEWTEEGNKILLVEIPSGPHEAAHLALHDIIRPALANHIAPRGSTTTSSNIPGNSALEADQSYRPIGNHPPGVTRENWVTLVIEIAKSQTLATVQAKANRWLQETTCLEVIIIAISSRLQSLRAQVWRRGAANNPIQALQFGGNHCTALGQQILQISLASIFGGAGNIPPAILALHPLGTLPIDLFPVKQAILDTV